MSKVAYFLSGWLIFSSTPQALTLQEAAQAAQSVATPSYGEILTHEKRVEILPPDAIGNTSELEKLKGNDGMGDILTPATNKTNACLKSGDPECLAIQVVKKNAAIAPDLDPGFVDDIHKGYQDIIGNANDITEGGSDIVSSEIHCETVETVIPGRSEIEVCDEGTGTTSLTCTQGWEMSEKLNILYHCALQSTSSSQVCTIERKVHSHVDVIASCLATPAQVDSQSCRFYNDAVIDVAFPYQCQIKESATKAPTCIKTLSVEVIPACDTTFISNTSMKVFKEVGYNASTRYQSLRVEQSCADTFKPIRIRFGSRTVGQFSEIPQTVNLTYILNFVATIVKDGNGYLITLTNVDQGQGTRTIQTRHPILSKQIQEIDHFKETCQ